MFKFDASDRPPSLARMSLAEREDAALICATLLMAGVEFNDRMVEDEDNPYITLTNAIWMARSSILAIVRDDYYHKKEANN